LFTSFLSINYHTLQLLPIQYDFSENNELSDFQSS